MDEKVLIKSQRYNVKKLFITLVIIGLVLSILGSIVCISSESDYYNSHYGDDHKHDKYCYEYYWMDDYYHDLYNGGLQEFKMDCPQVTYGNAFSYAIYRFFEYELRFWICLIPVAALALIGGLIYLWLRCYELTVTDKRIFGKLAWGKRVDLPIDSISAVGMGACKSIAVSTSSGRISFSAIKNRNEIHEVVSQLLVDRQKQTTPPAPSNTPASSMSNADELKKFKELLDAGIITQEEFDAKKKQLLGL